MIAQELRQGIEGAGADLAQSDDHSKGVAGLHAIAEAGFGLQQVRLSELIVSIYHLLFDCLTTRFVSWPTDLNAFGQLKELTLTANKISAFADMSGLKSLDTLYLIGNKLTTIGADILYVCLPSFYSHLLVN